MKVGFMPVTSIQKYSWIESDYYYAPADRRTHTGWVTVKRDGDGLRHDVEFFQYLIDTGATETKMHNFFEEHPAFLGQPDGCVDE